MRENIRNSFSRMQYNQRSFCLPFYSSLYIDFTFHFTITLCSSRCWSIQIYFPSISNWCCCKRFAVVRNCVQLHRFVVPRATHSRIWITMVRLLLMVLLMLLVLHHASVLIFKHVHIVVFECFAIGKFAFQLDCCLFSRGRRLFHPGGLMLVATGSTVVVVVVVVVIVHTSVVCSCFGFLLKKRVKSR